MVTEHVALSLRSLFLLLFLDLRRSYAFTYNFVKQLKNLLEYTSSFLLT